MRIRRHLFFYNTVSVLVALVVMLAVNSAATHAIGQHYQRQAEEMFRALPLDRRPEEGTLWIQLDEGMMELVGFAVPARPAAPGRPRPWMETMRLSLFLSGGAAIVVILLLNTLFTRYQLKKLLQPVDALARAAGRIETGDFTQAIDYQGRDEFARCAPPSTGCRSTCWPNRRSPPSMSGPAPTWWRASPTTCAPPSPA